MRKPAWIFDTRIIFSKEELNSLDINYWQLGTIKIKNASCRIRTCGPLLRRQLLYPAELRKLEVFRQFGHSAGHSDNKSLEKREINHTFNNDL